jgi:hypothetical protein
MNNPAQSHMQEELRLRMITRVWIRLAASSGLKYSAPLARNMAPAMLLFPAPLVPAKT